VATSRRVAITGGCGFVGSALGDRLRRGGHQIVAITRVGTPRAETVVDDLSDASRLSGTLRDHGIDTVVHAAWTGHPRSSGTDYAAQVSTNIAASTNVVLAAGTAGVEQVVLLSSGGALAERAAGRHLAPPAYGWAKRTVEAIAQATADSFGFDLTVLRPSAVYGPGQDPSKGLGAASVFARHILLGEVIEVFGTLDAARDFLHVADLADVTTALVEQRVGGTFEVGGPELVSLRTLIAGLEAAIGRAATVKVTAPTGVDRDVVRLDNEPLHAAVGWVPSRRITAHLHEVVADVAAHLGLPPGAHP
jgi:UDP-glucose 4-epimerase